MTGLLPGRGPENIEAGVVEVLSLAAALTCGTSPARHSEGSRSMRSCFLSL